MAITKTEQLTQITINGLTESSGNSCIKLDYRIKLDDPEDDQLPIYSSKIKEIWRYLPHDGEGPRPEADISGEDQLIQDIAALIWTD